MTGRFADQRSLNSEWSQAPKDGRKLHVTFPDGTPAVVFWGQKADKHGPEWLVGRKDGTMVSMRHEHGPSAPIAWAADKPDAE